MGKLVYGVGINDADYNVYQTGLVNGKKKIIWRCPYYVRWSGMLARCYNPKVQKLHPTYVGCSVVDSWHRFSTFKTWMEAQDWEGKELDKDLIVRGNKVYGPDTCVFIDYKINSFLREREGGRGELPIGVSFHKMTGRYQAHCRSVYSGKQEYLGLFSNPEEANLAWLYFKLNEAKILAEKETDERVAKALVDRFANYK